MSASNKVLVDKDEFRELVRETVRETLTQLGVDHKDPLEMQRDFQHLREWRKSVEAVKHKGMMAIVGVLITGALGALWLGLKEVLGQH